MGRQGFQARSPSISEILFSVSFSITFCPKVISATCATFSASVLVEKRLRALIFQNRSPFTPSEALRQGSGWAQVKGHWPREQSRRSPGQGWDTPGSTVSVQDSEWGRLAPGGVTPLMKVRSRPRPLSCHRVFLPKEYFTG